MAIDHNVAKSKLQFFFPCSTYGIFEVCGLHSPSPPAHIFWGRFRLLELPRRHSPTHFSPRCDRTHPLTPRYDVCFTWELFWAQLMSALSRTSFPCYILKFSRVGRVEQRGLTGARGTKKACPREDVEGFRKAGKAGGRG